jgi:hypothetical protein
MQSEALLVKGILVLAEKYIWVDVVIERLESGEVIGNEHNLAHKQKPNRQRQQNTHSACDQNDSKVNLILLVNLCKYWLFRVKIIHHNTAGDQEQRNLC